MFVNNSKRVLDILSQIMAYMSAQFGLQFYMHYYSVLIIKDIVYSRQGELAEFLHWFSEALLSLRGVDKTVATPSASNSLKAQ